MSYGGGIGAGCLTSARMSMSALVLKQLDNYEPYPVNTDIYGEWKRSQDPLTKEIVRVWEPYEDVPDDPNTVPNESRLSNEIPCLARGIVDGGIRVAGTTERFGDTYENIDFVKLWVPGHVRLTKRDRVTNIKDPSGHIRWRDEEYEQADPNKPLNLSDPTTYNAQLRATVFNVNGVTPLFDADNYLVEWFVLLERAEFTQDEG